MNGVWSFAGNHQRPSVNQFYTQYFINYNMKNGWYMGSSPIATYNWNVGEGDRWTVPFGWSVGRIVRVGKLPLNA